MEYAVQPRPGTHADTLWKRSIDDVDPEPIFVPRGAPPCLATAKVGRRSSLTRPDHGTGAD